MKSFKKKFGFRNKMYVELYSWGGDPISPTAQVEPSLVLCNALCLDWYFLGLVR